MKKENINIKIAVIANNVEHIKKNVENIKAKVKETNGSVKKHSECLVKISERQNHHSWIIKSICVGITTIFLTMIGAIIKVVFMS